jgi:hypothetical protein
MTSSTTPSHPAPPPSGPGKITGHDVAAATAVGAASKLGLRRRKDGVATGAAAGAGKAARPNSNRAQLMTALAVVVAMVGMLALMIVVGR